MESIPSRTKRHRFATHPTKQWTAIQSILFRRSRRPADDGRRKRSSRRGTASECRLRRRESDRSGRSPRLCIYQPRLASPFLDDQGENQNRSFSHVSRKHSHCWYFPSCTHLSRMCQSVGTSTCCLQTRSHTFLQDVSVRQYIDACSLCRMCASVDTSIRIDFIRTDSMMLVCPYMLSIETRSLNTRDLGPTHCPLSPLPQSRLVSPLAEGMLAFRFEAFSPSPAWTISDLSRRHPGQ